MNVYVSVDMEGVAGVAHLQQVMRGSDEFERSRRLMTEEANAAVAGSFDGGATGVVVNDSHGDMYNLLAEDMDPRAELILGSPKVPGSMMQGFGAEFDVVLFIGYHARAGTEAAVLDHTYAGRIIYDVRVNGESWTEAELNAALAGLDGVPVGMITGDDKACSQAAARLSGIRGVVVKQGMGRGVAWSIHPQKARELIRDAAASVAGPPAGSHRSARIHRSRSRPTSRTAAWPICARWSPVSFAPGRGPCDSSPQISARCSGACWPGPTSGWPKRPGTRGPDRQDSSSSAICTRLRAAPFRRLSPHANRASALGSPA
jgi:D-amino peptidase